MLCRKPPNNYISHCITCWEAGSNTTLWIWLVNMWVHAREMLPIAHSKPTSADKAHLMTSRTSNTASSMQQDSSQLLTRTPFARYYLYATIVEEKKKSCKSQGSIKQRWDMRRAAWIGFYERWRQAVKRTLWNIVLFHLSQNASRVFLPVGALYACPIS